MVRLGETNISRAGEDKFCRVQLYLGHAPPVLIEDTGADLYAVIDQVAERAGRNVACCVERRHDNVPAERLKPLVFAPGNTFAMCEN